VPRLRQDARRVADCSSNERLGAFVRRARSRESVLEALDLERRCGISLWDPRIRHVWSAQGPYCTPKTGRRVRVTAEMVAQAGKPALGDCYGKVGRPNGSQCTGLLSGVAGRARSGWGDWMFSGLLVKSRQEECIERNTRWRGTC
jgi:hypothetical protein